MVAPNNSKKAAIPFSNRDAICVYPFMSILRAQSLAGFLDSATMKIGDLISISSANNGAQLFDIQFLFTDSERR
jgi:hypothetical protein